MKNHLNHPPNHLDKEKSPYLLQHVNNPVDWHPWGEEAFTLARDRDRPLFISIGYSTCHWCHVMAHESFEDEEVAKLMNESFVNIKIDREERPDLDHIFMTVCQVMTGSGGWPLTILATPAGKPFFAATYIPKNERYGRPGMLQLIPMISDNWQNNRSALEKNVAEIEKILQKITNSTSGEDLTEIEIAAAQREMKRRFDNDYGGFSNAPKFPTPHNILFLLRYWKRHQDANSLFMVRKTLDNMRKGGIYDHIGYGFHRYSTDANWLVPHFEKMLYDQAMLTMAYTEGWQATGDPSYQQTAEEIIDYVKRMMLAPEGGFYTAEDADSEGEEGLFYLFSMAEIDKILNTCEADLVKDWFNLTVEGNFRVEHTGERNGGNILHISEKLKNFAERKEVKEEVLLVILETARQKLFAHREKRIHPQLDDKILTDWNGLMIAALAKAGSAFTQPEYITLAENAADFILLTLKDKQGNLLHRYRDKEAIISGNLDDYAFLSMGLFELHQATGKAKWLQESLSLMETMLVKFDDPENGGFFFTDMDGEKLLVRKKEQYDGAYPTGNSIAAWTLMRMSTLLGRPDLEERAMAAIRSTSKDFMDTPSAHLVMLFAVDLLVNGSQQLIVVDGDKGTSLLQQILSKYLPFTTILYIKNIETRQKYLHLLPALANYQSMNQKSTAYFCEGGKCSLPITKLQLLEEKLP